MRGKQEDLLREMCEIISDFSEESYCAGWLDGIEFTLLEWRNQLERDEYDPQCKFGIGSRMPENKLERLLEISAYLGMWVVWDDNAEENVWGDGEAGPIAVSLDEAAKRKAAYDKLYEDLNKKWSGRLPDDHR